MHRKLQLKPDSYTKIFFVYMIRIKLCNICTYAITRQVSLLMIIRSFENRSLHNHPTHINFITICVLPFVPTYRYLINWQNLAPEYCNSRRSLTPVFTFTTKCSYSYSAPLKTYLQNSAYIGCKKYSLIRANMKLNYIPIYFEQDATLHSLFISGNCSKCFGWYLHPSSEARTTVSTAFGICHTVIGTCRYRGVPNIPTIAAGSSNGVTNTRCCRYSCMRFWGWVEVPPETYRAVSRYK
jgi:hypothetical protein